MFILICGLPNAGKTTYSQRYQNVIHLDDIKIVNFSYVNTICDIIQNMDNVCLEGLLCLAKDRKQIVQSYKKRGQKIVIWLDVPVEECIARENRNRGTFLITNCASIFEPPSYEEGWDEIIHIKGGDNNGNL